MKNITFKTILVGIASAFAVSASATGPGDSMAANETDNIENLVSNIDDPTTAFLSLDTETGISSPMSATSEILAGDIIDYASKFLGRPYRSGAKGPSAFDCSGFTSFVFRNFDISLSPSSRDQYRQGESISRDEIQPGDLLFFSGRRGGKTVGHVAMAVSVDDNGTVRFIHASNRGGIRHDVYPDGGYYSQRYIGARRVLK
mgnify:CR=1 FL=1